MTIEIVAHHRIAREEVVSELWRRAKIMVEEFEKEPFNTMLSSGVHCSALLAPIGYPFVPSKKDKERYPWIAYENAGAIISGEDYAWFGYDEILDEINEYIWDNVMPYYEKAYEEDDQ